MTSAPTDVRIAPDGTMILSIVGQIPFGPGFTGVLKINLDTGEVIHEPHHFTEDVAARLRRARPPSRSRRLAGVRAPVRAPAR